MRFSAVNWFQHVSAAIGLLLGFVKPPAGQAASPTPLFQDALTNKLDEGWSWIREHKPGWRITTNGLQIRIQPGNMWGPANDARNVLVRSVPDPGVGAVAVEVTFSNKPTEAYEQMDLVWYYDDSHMVKIGLELVDGTRSIVMGREENDRTKTISILGHSRDTVRFRLIATADTIRGEYLFPGNPEWLVAGVCDLPGTGAPRISIQCYQGPGHLDRWGLIKDFAVYTLQAADVLGTRRTSDLP